MVNLDENVTLFQNELLLL